MILPCREHGPSSGEAPWLAWGPWRALDVHDLVWRAFFAALRLPVEYRLDHLRLAFVWHGSSPDTACYIITWFWLPSFHFAWIVLPYHRWEARLPAKCLDARVPILLAERIAAPVYVAAMPPGIDSFWASCDRCLTLPDDYEGHYVYFPHVGSDHSQLWCQCPHCGALGVQFEGRAMRNCDCSQGEDGGHNPHSRALCLAYQAARDCLVSHHSCHALCPWTPLAAPPALRR